MGVTRYTMIDLDTVLDQIERQQKDPLGLPPNCTSLDVARAIYQNPSMPINTRLRAAIAAMQFEHPKLGVNVVVDGKDWADRLDAAIERSRLAKLGFVPNNKIDRGEARGLRRL